MTKQRLEDSNWITLTNRILPLFVKNIDILAFYANTFINKNIYIPKLKIGC